MAEDKVTRTFPETEPRGLEEAPFRSHLADMLAGYLTFIARRELTYRPRTIVRPHNGGMRWSDMPFPNYPRWLELDEHREALRLPGVAKFFQYVWDRGELRRGFTGPDPQRRTWEEFLLQEVLHVPLGGVLSESALRQAVETGDIPDPWTLSTESTNTLLDELVRRYVYGKQTYVARCPLAWFDFDIAKSIDFGHGMKLRKYTPLEKALYLSRNTNRILWHDIISQLTGGGIAVLEINDEIDTQIARNGGFSRFDGRVTGAEMIKEHLADVIDVAKWALVTVTSKYPPPIEGVITFDSTLGDSLGGLSGGFFRREDKSSGTNHEVSEDELCRMRDLLSLALRYREISEDVRQGLWHWGRACLADLSRDRLVESVIGLESFLVKGHEQLGYQFRLHGAALLANSAADAQARFRELRDIYRLRGGAVHARGNAAHAESRAAHKAFGDALRMILIFFETRQLSPQRQVAEQIQEIVITNAWIERAEDL